MQVEAIEIYSWHRVEIILWDYGDIYHYTTVDLAKGIRVVDC